MQVNVVAELNMSAVKENHCFYLYHGKKYETDYKGIKKLPSDNRSLHHCFRSSSAIAHKNNSSCSRNSFVDMLSLYVLPIDGFHDECF